MPFQGSESEVNYWNRFRVVANLRIKFAWRIWRSQLHAICFYLALQTEFIRSWDNECIFLHMCLPCVANFCKQGMLRVTLKSPFHVATNRLMGFLNHLFFVTYIGGGFGGKAACLVLNSFLFVENEWCFNWFSSVMHELPCPSAFSVQITNPFILWTSFKQKLS